MEISCAPSAPKPFKYFLTIITFYITIVCLADILVHRLTVIHGFLMSSASLLIPVTYAVVDVVTEVYGYQLARKLIWYGIFAEIIFSVMGTGSNFLPNPNFWQNSVHYEVVLSPLAKNLIAYVLASFCGLFLNSYLISRWKILLKGRFFILRSLGSSIFGEFIYVIVGFSIEFVGVIPADKILLLMISSFLIKVAANIIYVWFASFLTTLLKRSENYDAYDDGISFNPFIKVPEKVG